MEGLRTRIVDGVRESDFVPGAAPTLKAYLQDHRQTSDDISRALPTGQGAVTVNVGMAVDHFSGRVALTVVANRGQTGQTWLGSGNSTQDALKEVIERMLVDPELRRFL